MSTMDVHLSFPFSQVPNSNSSSTLSWDHCYGCQGWGVLFFLTSASWESLEEPGSSRPRLELCALLVASVLLPAQDALCRQRTAKTRGFSTHQPWWDSRIRLTSSPRPSPLVLSPHWEVQRVFAEKPFPVCDTGKSHLWSHWGTWSRLPGQYLAADSETLFYFFCWCIFNINLELCLNLSF